MPLLREISKNNDKESFKTKTNIQAYTDTATRDREEKEYYNSDSARKWLLNRFSSKEIDLLKKEFGISSDSRLKVKVESMSDYDLDVLLHRLKNPAKPAYPEYQKPDDTKKPPRTPTVPSAPKPPTDLPEIIKPGQLDPNRITDTGTGGLSEFQAAKNTKHISGVDYNYLISYFKGNVPKAQDAVISLKEDELRKMINAQKGFSGYAAGQLSGNDSTIKSKLDELAKAYSEYKTYEYKNLQQDIQDDVDETKQKYDDIKNAGKGLKELFTKESEYAKAYNDINQAWDKKHSEILAKNYTVYDVEDMKDWSMEQIAEENIAIDKRKFGDMVKESQMLLTDIESQARQLEEKIEGEHEKLDIQRSALLISAGKDIYDMITGGPLKEVIMDLAKGKIMDWAGDILYDSAKDSLENVDVDTSNIQTVKDLIDPPITGMLNDYVNMLNMEKDLAELNRAVVAMEEIHQNNVDCYNGDFYKDDN